MVALTGVARVSGGRFTAWRSLEKSALTVDSPGILQVTYSRSSALGPVLPQNGAPASAFETAAVTLAGN